MTRSLAPEFSRPVAVATLRQGGETMTLTATPLEEAALARRLGVEAVRGLAAELTVKPRGRGLVSVRGRVRATLGRLCVVSLEPLEEAIDERLSVVFRPAGEAQGEAAAEVALDPEAVDEELYEGGEIDLGELVAQTLALALDPWPRAPGAHLPAGDEPGRQRE